MQILDGTVIPIDRLSRSQNRRYYAGKHCRHGVNARGHHRPARPADVHLRRVVTVSNVPGRRRARACRPEVTGLSRRLRGTEISAGSLD
jgi:hypothetical protein